MDLWKILVLGTLRLNCNWDYDKVHDIANEHNKVREFLGHTIYELDQRYGLQTNPYFKDSSKYYAQLFMTLCIFPSFDKDCQLELF